MRLGYIIFASLVVFASSLTNKKPQAEGKAKFIAPTLIQSRNFNASKMSSGLAMSAVSCAYRHAATKDEGYNEGHDASFCELVEKEGWSVLETYNAISVGGDKDNAELWHDGKGRCLLAFHGIDSMQEDIKATPVL